MDAMFLLFSLFSWFGFTLQRVVLPPRLILQFYLYAREVSVNGKHSWLNNEGKNQLITRNLTILTHKVEVPGSLGGYHEETKETIRQ